MQPALRTGRSSGSFLRGCFLAAAAAGAAQAEDSASWTFEVSAADDLQDMLFGSAVRQGWLGGEHPSSFHVGGGQYVWIFGDSFTNFSGDTPRGEAPGTPTSSCNYYPSRRCHMPTNTFAMWDNSMPDVALTFHAQLDKRTGEPTSILWPPGWGGAGRTPKEPACKSCSLWHEASDLGKADCGNGSQVQADKGGCCSRSLEEPACHGYCCHDELYLKPRSGIASSDGSRALILANLRRDSEDMRNGGLTYGTMAVAVNTASAPVPTAWDYVADRMPGTEMQPWRRPGSTPEFFSAIVSAREPSQKDLVFILGSQGDDKVLARANLTDLLDFTWDNVEFWSASKTWKRYVDGEVIPELGTLWRSPNPSATLHFDGTLRRWIAPEVDAETDLITILVADSVTGPYEAWPIGGVPPRLLHSNISGWTVSSVSMHPELSSQECTLVLSLVFAWRSADDIPPAPGLHNYPRLLCVAAMRLGGVEEEVAANASAEAEDNASDPEGGEQGSAQTCSTVMLKALAGKLACGDLGDGCHSCGGRATWIVEHEGKDIDAALQLIAAEFPKACGEMMRCTAELRDFVALAEAGPEEHRGGAPALLPKLVGPTVWCSAGLLVIGVSLRALSGWRGMPDGNRQLCLSPGEQDRMLP